MHLITDGLVHVGNDKGHGRLVLTGTSIFALRSNAGATMAGGALGGLIGALIGMFLDKKRAEKAPPTFVDGPELSCLTEKERKSLLTTGLLAKLPIDGSLSVKRTGMGFDFVSNSGEPVIYKGKIHQKKIAKFLEEHGVKVGS